MPDAPDLRKGRRTAHYKPNNASMRGLLMSERTRDVAAAAAADIIPLAKGFSPRSDDEGEHYADKFEVDDTRYTLINDMGHPNLRRSARVVNNTEYAVDVEFGEAPTLKERPQGGNRGPAQRPLGRAGVTFAAQPGMRFSNDKTGQPAKRP